MDAHVMHEWDAYAPEVLALHSNGGTSSSTINPNLVTWEITIRVPLAARTLV